MGCGRDHTGSLMGADELHFLPAGGTAIGFQPCGARVGRERPGLAPRTRAVRPLGKSLHNTQRGECLIMIPPFPYDLREKEKERERERGRAVIGLR